MNKLERKLLKNFYKRKKNQDALIGREINEIVSQMITKKRDIQKNNTKATEVDALTFKEKLNELDELRNVTRFRHDFPSFAKFKEFYRKSKFTIEDLKTFN